MVVAIAWSTDPRPAIRLIDQTRLPHEEIYLDVRTVDALVTAIRDLAVRGAPALGAAGALGVAMAMLQGRELGWDEARLQRERAGTRRGCSARWTGSATPARPR